MKVSFLVTYYNQREYVKQSMDSILAIDKPCDWEILVGDDGSSDGTIEEVNRYVEQYPEKIKLYVMPRESEKKYDSVRRASANRLNILEKCSGDIFCTLDGDDFFCDIEFVKEAIEIFRENSDISVVAFGFKYFQETVFSRDYTLPSDMNYQIVDKTMYLEKLYLPAGGCVHRKAFGKERIDYIKKLGCFDDNNIVINSLNYGEMYAVNRPIYAYRQTGQSVYTSMNNLEQAVLNVQGMDADIRLVDDSLQDVIKKRYATAVITMYIWRKEIRSILGEDKCLKYEDGCKSLIPSYCYDLLSYSDLCSERKKELNSFLNLNKKYTIKQCIKYYLRGVIR